MMPPVSNEMRGSQNQCLRHVGDVEEIALGRMAVLPEDRVARRVGEALQLANRLGKHGGVVVLADDPVAPLVLLKEGRGEVVVAEAAATFPVVPRRFQWISDKG